MDAPAGGGPGVERGDSSVSFTLDVYSHAVPALQADAADTIADLLGDSSGDGNDESNSPAEDPSPSDEPDDES